MKLASGGNIHNEYTDPKDYCPHKWGSIASCINSYYTSPVKVSELAKKSYANIKNVVQCTVNQNRFDPKTKEIEITFEDGWLPGKIIQILIINSTLQ